MLHYHPAVKSPLSSRGVCKSLPGELCHHVHGFRGPAAGGCGGGGNAGDGGEKKLSRYFKRKNEERVARVRRFDIVHAF